MNWSTLDELWSQRHDPAQLSALEKALDQSLTESGAAAEYGLLWRYARLAHFRAMQADANATKGEAYHHFARGAQRARQAVRLQWYGVEGNFWYGVNLIEAARRHPLEMLYCCPAWRALSIATWHIERAASIDETYHFAGPLRVWGRLTHLRPLLLGGSVERAIVLYRRALQIAPDNSTTLLYYAEALLADKQQRAAREVLKRIIEASDDPDWRWEQERDRGLAQALLESIKSA
jgi:tetratricopeptide (TPR) repeat protein